MSTLRFSTRDRVRLKEGLVPGQHYGGWKFVELMENFEGIILEVDCIDDSRGTNGYRLLDENGNKIPCWWTDEMLDLYTDNKDESLEDSFSFDEMVKILI